jgi:hypothetical protein
LRVGFLQDLLHGSTALVTSAISIIVVIRCFTPREVGTRRERNAAQDFAKARHLDGCKALTLGAGWSPPSCR